VRSLLLAASFRPALGGIETLLYQTNRRLSDPPLVVAPWPAAAPDIAVRGISLTIPDKVAYRPLWKLHPSLHYAQSFWGPSIGALKHTRPRVIQAGHVYLAPLAWLLARRFGLPFVVYAYGQEVWRSGRRMGQLALDAQLRGGALRAADRVLVPGSFTHTLLSEWMVPTKNIVSVPYGAEPRPASPAPFGNRLLSVARLIPRKGIDTVICAMRGLPPDVEYRVVGSGPDGARLRQLATSVGIEDRVHFLGRLSEEDLAEEYRNCSLFVLPARRTNDGDLEGYGLVYFEAAAWGRPVVAGRSGGEVDAVIDGETGVLVDGDSVDAVQAAIGSLLNDPGRLSKLGARGRARVETSHNWSQAAATVDAILDSLI
jgi:glycosyltransferase involved in cell wall biosynthesis